VVVAVADDDPDLRELAAAFLRDQGMDVVEVCDGAALLRILRDGGVELVITDECMPRLHGCEVLLTQRRTGDETPFVVITGTPDAVAEAVACTSHASLLRKPFTRDAFRHAVAEALARH
jgi:DNA-binding NtrC family response regulator